MIFVQGIMERTGTHFLQDLLCLHPECGPVRVPEDRYLVAAGHLETFADRVSAFWTKREPDASVKPTLLANLGAGLVATLRTRCEAPCPVTTSPKVRNLHLFRMLFPTATLLVTVRDPRATAESAAASFGFEYEWSFRNWAHAAREVLAFRSDPANASVSFRIVRYEDLFQHTRETMKEVLACVGLDASRYDYDAIDALPVRGSSQLGREGGRIHWRPVPRTPDFDPLGRTRSWSAARQRRCAWIAREPAAAFGYPLPPVVGHWAELEQHLLDVRWAARRSAGRARRRARTAWTAAALTPPR